MDGFENRLYALLVERIEKARGENKERAVSQYNPGLNYYHAAVAREIAFTDILTWLDEPKKEMEKN